MGQKNMEHRADTYGIYDYEEDLAGKEQGGTRRYAGSAECICGVRKRKKRRQRVCQ